MKVGGLSIALLLLAAPALAEEPKAGSDAQLKEKLAAQEQRLRALEQAAERHDEQQVQTEMERAIEESEEDVVSAAQGQLLKIYGYADVGWQKTMAKKTSLIYQVNPTNANTFVLGNLNLFFDAQPSESWRGLTELRFTNAPHGNDLSYASAFGTEYEREDSTVNDPTGGNGRNDVLRGSVIIERAWIQYSHSNELNVRAGYFLAPFGIWNIDHGTPTLISLALPDFQIAQYFPLRQTGVEALGSTFAGPWELGYHATLSNGRSVGQMDIDENKAVGARLFATHNHASTRLTLGTSAYHGAFSDYQKRLTGVDPLRVETETTVSGKEWALGADVSLDLDGWRVRGEAAMQHISYEADKRAPVSGPPGAVAPDQYRWDGYGLLAYRVPNSAFEPYGFVELLHRPSSLGDTVVASSVGMNIYFTPAAQLKLQYTQVRFLDTVTTRDQDPSDHDFAVFLSRLVLAF
jgi:hypothetical protein